MSVQVFESMIGVEMESVQQVDGNKLIFRSKDGKLFRFFHDQDCCEIVYIQDIIGDLEDLVGSPLTLAEEISNADAPKPENADESYTWTFYRFGSGKGTVTVRWLGMSNGYYSEGVSFKEN